MALFKAENDDIRKAKWIPDPTSPGLRRDKLLGYDENRIMILITPTI
jgi:hypothetical protein